MCTVLLPPGGYPIAVKYIISYHIPSGHSMALGSTQPLSEMNNQEYFLGGGVKAAGA
jgi:hypothetical protein